jgi:hypothetical protein
MKRICQLSVIFAGLIIAVSVQGRIIVVPGEYSNIQEGINASANGDTVLVAPGTYRENINLNGHNIMLGSLFLCTGDTSFIASTIIDGNSAGSVITISSGENSTMTIIGFTITNGMNPNGGGVYCIDSSPTIRDNIIVNNITSGTIFSNGGGICCRHSGAHIISNRITNNNSLHPDTSSADFFGGGGIALFADSSTLIDSNIIEMNATEGCGGGVYCETSAVDISNNAIINNMANHNRGGGIYCEASGGIITGNSIIANSALDGGGIASTSINTVNLIIQDNLIKRNAVSPINGSGGGIYCLGRAKIYRSVIDSNQAYQGGGVFGFFAFYTIDNCVITSNSIPYMQDYHRGTGVHCQHSTLSMANCTISDNYTGLGGDAIYLGNVTANMINCITWNNSPPTIGLSGGSDLTAVYSDLENGLGGQGNICIDPSFRGNGDYRLSSVPCGQEFDSPCIDAGIPDSSDGMVDCLHGLGTPRSDMGAFGGWLNSWPVGIEDHNTDNLPLSYSLSQNYPNPFNAQTTISFALPLPCHVNINIYDILGRRIADLLNEDKDAGRHQVIWNAGDVSSGIYFYRIMAGDKSETRKMMLLK